MALILVFVVCFSCENTTLEDMDEGAIASMKMLGVTESYKLKRQVVLSASEAAEMIIRCVVFSFFVVVFLIFF